MQCGGYAYGDGGRSAVVRARFESLRRNKFNCEAAQASVVRVQRLNIAWNAIFVHNGRKVDDAVELNAVPG